MRRLRAAATPAAFFIGLALICASLIEFQRWPYLETRVHRSDLELNYETWVPGLEGLIAHAHRPFRSGRFEEPPSIQDFTETSLEAAGWVGLFGLVAVVVRRRVLGGALLLAAGLAGTGLLGLVALDLRLYDYRGGCGPASAGLRLTSPMILEAAEFFACCLAALIAAAWLAAQVQAGLRLRLTTVGAAAIALGMVALTFAYGRMTTGSTQHGAIPPEWPAGALAALLGVGLLVSVFRPLCCSSFVSSLFLLVGSLSFGAASTIAHDERLELDEQRASTSKDITPIETETCGSLNWQPVIQVSPFEVLVPGAVMGKPDEDFAPALFTVLNEIRDRDSALGDGRTSPALSLQVDQAAPMTAIRTILRASARSGTHAFDIVSFRTLPSPLWTRSATHVHACALRIEIANEGQPLSEFADWPALVSAADLARGGLRVRVE